MPPPPQPAPSLSPCNKVFTMTIASYAEAKKLANGTYFQSDPVDVGGHSWRIAFYPNGYLAGTTASMSIFLLLDDDDDDAEGAGAGEDVQVKFSFMMQDPSDDDALVLMSGQVAAAFSARLNACGFEWFVSRENFEKTALFKADRLKIRCDLTVFPSGIQPAVEASRSGKPAPSVAKAPPPAPKPKPSVARAARPSPTRTPPPPTPSASPAPSVEKASPLSAASPRPSVGRATTPSPPVQPEPPLDGGPPTPKPYVVTATAPLSGLPADLGRLLETKEGADVEFEVCGKVFAAHKSVLAARSSVLKEEFFGPMKEKDTSYVLIGGDMHPEAFEALLHYMYTDSLPERMTMTIDSVKKGAELAEDLLNAAERYDLKDLKALTEKKLCSHVGVTTVLLMLALAEQYQCCKLKKMCLGFIVSSSETRAIMASKDVENLARSSPSVIKDVIAEILDARERSARVITVYIYALCFVLAFLVFTICRKE